jgi:membrane-bound lytic murein transglycosylase D
MLKRKLLKTITGANTMMIVIATALVASGQPSADSILQQPVEDSVIEKMITVPVLLNKEARQFAVAFIKENNPTLHKLKQRSESYFPIIDSVFSNAGIPTELKYLAVIESNLKPSVTSKAGAAGLWQLMPVAGRMLGLKMVKGYDERRHTYKSTQAAARLLKQLHDQFGNWLLAVAAYNSGPGNVRKAIRKAGTDDFWKLQYHLPAETRKHVKKFISMHYYFEGTASEICLTKKELEKHNRELEKLIAAETQQAADTSPAEKNTMQPDEPVAKGKISEQEPVKNK